LGLQIEVQIGRREPKHNCFECADWGKGSVKWCPQR
jgi:hypothetical protein